MAYPPPVLPTNRTNADPQQDQHPADHNQLALAINDMMAGGGARRYTAPFLGGNLVATGGSLGITDSFYFPVVSYARIIQVRLTALVTALAAGTTPDVQIRNNSLVLVAADRVSAANNSVTVIWDQLLPAGVDLGFQGLIANTNTCTVSPNTQYGQFSGLAWPAS